MIYTKPYIGIKLNALQCGKNIILLEKIYSILYEEEQLLFS
jgi:hypothetical protein